MIGRVISGRYVVQAVVGTGGMAVVYRAYDKIKKRIVAIKVLRPEYQTDEEFVRRFSREAEAASKVSHENIVNMLDVGIDGEKRYIVMEYVDGQTLKDMIREQGRIEPDQALRMTIRILAAVDHAHRNGIVHRDIKPQNILVDRQGRVKVADFGIARLKASQTTRIDDGNGAPALGSVHYFSPEQARGEVADEKSDLYSVGVVMYEMLTGQVPFDGETSVSVALKHVSEEPKPMRLFQSGISKALDEVVMRALCKDKDKRYQTAAEMAADLRKTISHPRGGFVKYPEEPQQEEKPHELRKRKRLPKNRRRMVGIAAVVVAAIALAALAGWYVLAAYNRVTVPDVRGMDQAAAQAALESLGIPVTVERDYSEDVEKGLVISQSDENGARIRKGESVSIVVSEGTQWYYLENLVGREEDQALALLRVNEVKDVVVQYVQSTEPVGSVVSQSVEIGWQSKETAMVLSVSGRSVLMPPLTGLTLEGAEALILSEGLLVGTISEDDTSDAPTHTVVAQNVAPNTKVLAGTAIDLTISRRREGAFTPKSRFTIVVPLENLRVEVVLITPSGGEIAAFNSIMREGTYQIDLVSTEAGTHTVRVYIDEILTDSTKLFFE